MTRLLNKISFPLSGSGARDDFHSGAQIAELSPAGGGSGRQNFSSGTGRTTIIRAVPQHNGWSRQTTNRASKLLRSTRTDLMYEPGMGLHGDKYHKSHYQAFVQRSSSPPPPTPPHSPALAAFFFFFLAQAQPSRPGACSSFSEP